MTAPTRAPLPLAGIRVLDFTWGGAGPFATKALADHGAEVIKIETSTHFDFPRTMGPYAGKKKGINRSAYFTNRNSSKRGVTLNLKDKQAIALAKQLVPSCDIVANNFRAGTLEKLGLGYQDVAALRSDVIYVSMPLQGTGGPQAEYSGVGHTLNVLSGIYGLTGYGPDDITGPGTNFPDHSVNPGHALVAILGAIAYRRRTGLGQYIEVSQLESTLNLLGPTILSYSLDRKNPAPTGNANETAAPYGVFRCAGEDRWVALSVATDAHWSGLARAAEGEAWTRDPRHASAAGRLANRDALQAAVATWTSGLEPFALMERLQACGVPAGVVQDASDLVERDPQLAARQHFVTIDHPEMGPTVYNAAPFKLSKSQCSIRTTAPLLGQHNEEVFKGWLGLGDAEYTRLHEAGVFK
jgi:benzylsuccinate CoA-transferase BbsF subunit